MRLLYGTFNPGKLRTMRRRLEGSGIELIGLSELPTPPEDAVENGGSPGENARIKAETYRRATGMTVLAADSALYIDGLSDAEQPAEHPRRMGGERMDDEQMMRFFSELARIRFGGRAVARYRNALCIAFADGRIAEVCDDSVASEPFYLVSEPHRRRTKGFPLDSLSVDIKSGQYYFDMETQKGDRDLAQADGYRNFIMKAMGLLP